LLEIRDRGTVETHELSWKAGERYGKAALVNCFSRLTLCERFSFSMSAIDIFIVDLRAGSAVFFRLGGQRHFA